METAQKFPAAALYALDAWDFSNFYPVDAIFPEECGIAKEEPIDNLFEGPFGPLDDGSIWSQSIDYIINPGDIWACP